MSSLEAINGIGPWNILLVTDTRSKQHRLLVHSYPELEMDAMNALQPNKVRWMPIMMMGPFTEWRACFNMWSEWNKMKQLKTKIENGMTLFNTHKNTLDIYLWIQGESNQNYIANRWESCGIEMPPVLQNDFTTVKSIKLVEKKRE
jgi:hypothetical protein